MPHYYVLICSTPSSLYLRRYQGNRTGLSIVLRTPMSFKKRGIALVFYQLVISPRSFDTNESVHKSINQSNRIFFIKSKIWQLGQARRHASGFLFIAKAQAWSLDEENSIGLAKEFLGLQKNSNGIECRADGRSKNMGGYLSAISRPSLVV